MIWHPFAPVDSWPGPRRFEADPWQTVSPAATRVGLSRRLFAAALRVVELYHRQSDPLLNGDRSRLLRRASLALRVGDLDEVERLISTAGRRAAGDAAGLNLFGVVCEARGRTKAARRFYGLAMRADPAFAPAEGNMRRLYELRAFGRTSQAVAVGDLETDLWLERMTGAKRRIS